MITYRSYRNSDPPHLLRIWADCAGRPGLIQPLTMAYLERSVLNKPYFDPRGLFLAFDDDRPVGFAHAGFAPASDFRSGLCREKGITCLVLVSQDYESSGIAEKLLWQCEEYLTTQGARILYGGSASPWHPFYLGLYGGLQLPGILESDTQLVNTFMSHDYRVDRRYQRFQLNLENGLRPLDVALRFQFARFCVVKRPDPPPAHWWDAVSYCESEITDYLLIDPTTERAVARVRYCKHQPNPHSWPAVGLAEIRVANGWQQQKADRYLLANSLACLRQEGISIVEAQCVSTDAATVELLTGIGFRPATSSLVFRKDV